MTPEEQIKKLEESIQALKGDVMQARQQLTDSSAFIEDASVLVTAIMKSPELKTQVQQAINGQPVTPQPQTQQNQQTNQEGWKFDPVTGKPIGAPEKPQEPVKDKRIDGIDGNLRLKAIDAVESKFKIAEKDRAIIRKNVGSWLRSYNMEVAEIPIDQLEEKLRDAYLHVGLESSTKEGKADAVLESYFEDPGRFPSMGSGNPNTSDTTLTATHKKWANKFEIPEDKVVAGLKELQETGVITYKPKEKQQVNQNPLPSGTPTPPASE